jgi:hypothetical protein
MIAQMSQAVSALALCAAAAISLPAQTLTTLYDFNGVDGREPYFGALVQARNGDLYRTTSYGAAVISDGTIFKFSPGGGP